MSRLTMIACTALVLATCSGAALASGTAGHGTHGMGGHGSATMHADGATGTGVLEEVRADEGVVNITHDPLPAIGWPKMTMDLPVTRRVDLGQFKSGDKVEFELKKGRDDVFRIVTLKAAP